MCKILNQEWGVGKHLKSSYLPVENCMSSKTNEEQSNQFWKNFPELYIYYLHVK